MTRSRVAVLGAGVAGLGASLLLARVGHEVTVVERDPMPEVSDGDRAFADWERRSVPQWRFVHSFSTRARKLLLERAPDVLDRLRADGIEEYNILHVWTAPEDRRPDDDQFVGVRCRRPAFELALRRAVEAQPRIRLLSPTVATGLILDPDPIPTVRGLRLDNGVVVEADLVLDCGGRRSRVAAWLADAGIDLPIEVEDCQLTYYSRYFRRQAGVVLPRPPRARIELGYLFFWTFGGDHDTYGAVFAVPPWDAELKVLRHTWAWEALAGAIPSLAPWTDPANGVPLHAVQVMAGHQNTLRHPVVDGRPSVFGLLQVGDALCTTNPTLGWGASMALTHAAAATDALVAHGSNLEAVALAYHEAVAEETAALYQQSAATDRIRTARWLGESLAETDRETARRQDLLEAALSEIGHDPELNRALLRRHGLLESPNAIFADATIMAKAQAAHDRAAAAPVSPYGPDREEALAVIAQADPARESARPNGRTRPAQNLDVK